MPASDDFSDDAFLGGALRLRQPRGGHRAGHDALLLAASTGVKAGDRVADFGAGVGAAGLVLARRVPGIALTLVEIDPGLAALARFNGDANGVPADVLRLDLQASPQELSAGGLAPDSFDAVLMNPPFNDAARHRGSPDAGRRSAHVAADDTLATWIGAARRVLTSHGSLTLIWRADGLVKVLAALSAGFGSIAVQAVHSEPGKPAIRILARAIKGGKSPLLLLPGLNLSDAGETSQRGSMGKILGLDALPLARLG